MPTLLSHRHPALYKLAVTYHRAKRHLRWMFEKVNYASSSDTGNRLPINVKKHSSRLIRKLGDSDLRLQRNKVTNLKCCLPLLDGIIIKPGETFSFCKIVGKPTTKRGFIEGMELSMGKPKTGIGGGICQLANMLHWLTLHSPMTILERSTHSFDPFPDSKRSIPFGTGCAVFYNYVDYSFKNETNLTFQIHLSIDEENLNGQLTSSEPTEHTYKVFEKNHKFFTKNSENFRTNEIWRKVLSRHSGNTLREEHLKTNLAKVLYPIPTDQST